MTLANVTQSLQACNVIAIKSDGRDYTRVCTEGVYMQLFQPLEPEDFALVDMLPYKPIKENLSQFCKEFSTNDTQYGACYREAWPLFGNDIYSSDGLNLYCSQLTQNQDIDSCYVSVFTIVGRHGLAEPEKMAETCNGIQEKYRGMCFARVANAFPEENPDLVKDGVAFCAQANTKTAQDECYTFLANVASFNFHAGSSAFEELCTLLPAEFEAVCRSQ